MECGECTLCCKLLETHDFYSPIGEYCKFCNINEGCSIYNSRPQECKEYLCMWVQMEYVGEELRPDKCGIIFDRVSDKVVHGRKDEDIELSIYAKRQIQDFLKQGFSVMILEGNNRNLFLAEGHLIKNVEKDIKEWQHQAIQKI